MTLQTTGKITGTSRLLHLRILGPLVFVALLCLSHHTQATTPAATATAQLETGYTVQHWPTLVARQSALVASNPRSARARST